MQHSSMTDAISEMMQRVIYNGIHAHVEHTVLVFSVQRYVELCRRLTCNSIKLMLHLLAIEGKVG